MIRLYRQIAEHVVLMLLFMRHNGFSPTVIRDRAFNGDYRGLTDTIPDLQKLISRAADDGTPSHDEMLVDLVNACNQSVDKKKGHLGDFIDQMVKVLQLPWGRQYISGGDMAALRKAFLLPEEMSDLTRRLTEREFSCYSCHRQLSDYEMITYKFNRMNACAEIFCVQCVPPKIISCTHAGCEGKCGLPSAVTKAITKEFNCGNSHDAPKSLDLLGPEIVSTGGGFYGESVRFMDEQSPFRNVPWSDNNTVGSSGIGDGTAVAATQAPPQRDPQRDRGRDALRTFTDHVNRQRQPLPPAVATPVARGRAMIDQQLVDLHRQAISGRTLLTPEQMTELERRVREIESNSVVDEVLDEIAGEEEE